MSRNAGCDRDCECESEEVHDAMAEEAERDFLRDVGQPPAHFTPEQTARARLGIAEARTRLGMVNS